MTESSQTTKTKRTLTPGNFFKTVANFAVVSPTLVKTLIRPKIPFVLREKLCLAVTSINDCRFCQWGHTHWALSHGVPLEEVNQILGHQYESLKAKDPAEAVAVLFAQHYAEQLDQFDPESLVNLRKYFSDAQVKEILAHVRFITLTNLSGNTVDAFLDRVRGNGEPIGSFQFVVGAGLAPLLLLIVTMAKLEQKLGLIKLRSRLFRSRHDVAPEPDLHLKATRVALNPRGGAGVATCDKQYQEI